MDKIEENLQMDLILRQSQRLDDNAEEGNETCVEALKAAKIALEIKARLLEKDLEDERECKANQKNYANLEKEELESKIL